MKLKVGNKLMWEREDRKMNQTEMAAFLGMSQSAYSRLERNEVSVEIEEVVNFAKKLQVPIQDFLPDTLSFHSNNQNGQHGQIGLIIGNVYYYGSDEALKAKDQEVSSLQQKIGSLEDKIAQLEALINKFTSLS